MYVCAGGDLAEGALAENADDFEAVADVVVRDYNVIA
jgi:hypothetical protein